MAIKAYIIHNFFPRWFINCNIVLCRRGHWLNNRNVRCGIVAWKKYFYILQSFSPFNSKLSVGREVTSASEYLARHLHDGSVCVCVANRRMFVFAWVTRVKNLCSRQWKIVVAPLFFGCSVDTRVWMWLHCHAVLAAHSLHSAKSRELANTITGCRMSRKGTANKLVALHHCGPYLDFLFGRRSVLWKTQT